ncbi:homeobox protein six [Holotrichia oblita]|uniref:Homeobox protein six n=1 Tax=Holotrichia oblita TaxID=644536 RepID=A0ACB9TXD2_HOLOL|nr:homeobox protein six [Holotrichia oblita]
MNSLPMQRYMQELRQLYNANYTDEQIIEYIFQDKKIQHYEHLYRSRDKSRESKRPTTCLDDKNIHTKPFDLYKPPKKKPYERLIVNMDKYKPLKTELLRSFSEFSLDFDVFNHKPGEAPTEPPPYHIDFWNVTCKVHYPPDD